VEEQGQEERSWTIRMLRKHGSKELIEKGANEMIEGSIGLVRNILSRSTALFS
jgi:hypothetical protein